jgi:hypothetical protein
VDIALYCRPIIKDELCPQRTEHLTADGEIAVVGSDSECQTRTEKMAGGEGVRHVGMWACSAWAADFESYWYVVAMMII